MIYKDKLDKVRKKMEENSINQLLISDKISLFYLTGKMIDSMERMCALYVDVNGTTEFVVSKIYPQNEDFGCNVHYFDDVDDPVELLSKLMRKSKTVGVDKNWPAKFLLPFMQTGVGENYVNASFIVDGLRQIKTEEEQTLMQKASEANDKAMEAIIPYLTEGRTEEELGEILLKIYRSLGASDFSFEPIIAFGDNGADPHHVNNKTVGKKGDCVIIDIGCVLNGYCSDMTRTVFLGEVNEEARKIYEIVKEANLRGIAAVHPGARFCDIDKAARDYITECGYGEYFTHRLGHSIGIETHEWGDVSSANTAEVQPGMIFSIEPGIYKPGAAGVRIEDLVLVTENGCKVLNSYPKDLKVIDMK